MLYSPPPNLPPLSVAADAEFRPGPGSGVGFREREVSGGMAAAAARVDLRALLAECVAACGLGCGEVRAWQAARTAETGAELKDPNDLRR